MKQSHVASPRGQRVCFTGIDSPNQNIEQDLGVRDDSDGARGLFGVCRKGRRMRCQELIDNGGRKEKEKVRCTTLAFISVTKPKISSQLILDHKKKQTHSGELARTESNRLARLRYSRQAWSI
jgi:hypothetical protein